MRCSVASRELGDVFFCQVADGIHDVERSRWLGGVHKRQNQAHANTIEFAPVLMVLMYILSQSQMAGWVLWSIILVTLCRFILVAGLIFPRTMSRPNPIRQIGAGGTYIFGLALCVAVLQLAAG